MPDRVAQILPALQSHRLPGLDLGSDFIYPAYERASILNLPSSICQLLGAPGLGAGPLDEVYLAPLGSGVQRVILVIMDALALHRLRRWLAEGAAPAWQALAERGVLAPITSITPSTTSAALTALWTGRSAAEHGITGYEMWLKEYGVVANTITHSPIGFRGDAGSLAKAGFTPLEFMSLPTLGPHLAEHGVQTHVFQHHSILHSGLSQIYFQAVESHPFSTTADLWINLRRLLAERPRERMYVYIYWSEIDTFGHFYGPDSEQARAEFTQFSLAFERLFLKDLPAALRQDTAVILAADHGQVATTPDPHYSLNSHPGLGRRLHLQPTGENRLAFLYPRPGQTEAVREYLERTWPRQFSVIDSAYAVETGLFGSGKPHPRLLDRVGDLIAAAHGNAYLWWSNKENQLLGRHGGLHPEEMLVPFLASRL